MAVSTPAPQTVGQRIRWARRNKGYSQETLAGKIGSTRQLVIRWEQDRHAPNATSRSRLAEALGHDPGFFADQDGGDDDEEPSDLALELALALQRFAVEFADAKLLEIRAEREKAAAA